MKTRTTLISLIAVALLLSLGQVAKAEVPFMINYFDGTTTVPVTSAGYSQLAAGGFTTVNSRSYHDDLDLAQANGLKVMVDFNEWGLGGAMGYNPSYIEERAIAVTQGKSSHPAYLGCRIQDEPSLDEFPALALAQEKFLYYDALYDGRTGASTHVPWMNIYPNYSYSAVGYSGGFGINPATGQSWTHKQYMDAFMSTVQPKLLSYDDYTAAQNTTYPADVKTLYWHYSNLKRFREYGLAYDIPYQRCILSTQLPNSTTPEPGDFISPDPDEGMLRFQTYSSLAYGFTGITYFNYWTWDHYDNQGAAPALIDPSGNPTAKYYYAQAINNEMKNLAPTLQKLTSWSVHHTNAPDAAPGWVPAEDKETFYSGVDNFYVTGVSGGPMVLGNFIDENYRTYYMLVNDDYENGHNFTVNLHPTHVPKGLGKYNKNTGHLHLVSTPGNTLSLSLAAGDGELFKVLADNTLASKPGNLNGTGQSATEIDVNWNASYDSESGIDYYYVYRDGEEIGTSTSLFYSDAGLLADTSYVYSIAAVNGEGLDSQKSLPALISTLPVVETPTAYDDPMSGHENYYNTDEDNAIFVISSHGVLINDTDPNGDPLTATNASDPAHGTVVLLTDGSLYYTPDENYNGSDSFTYKAFDGSNLSNVATVNLAINAINDLPVGENDAYDVPWNGEITVSVVEGLLANDSDVDGDDLIVELLAGSDPLHGDLVLNDDGSLSYEPDGYYSGDDEFSYRVFDGTEYSDAVTCLLTVAEGPIPGDFNEDDTVDVSDLGILASNYGTASGADWSMGDANEDGAVDVNDLGILTSNYGATSSSVAIPEPSMLVLVAGMLLAVGLLRRN